MGKLSKFFLTIGIIFLTIVIALYLVYITKLKADNEFCQQLLMKPKRNGNFFVLLEELSEKVRPVPTTYTRYTSKRTWRDMENVYTILYPVNPMEVYEKPTEYFSDALKVIASPDFDQS